MPNQKQRKKKAGRNKTKKAHAMRESVTRRKASATPKRQKKQRGAAAFKPDGADKGVRRGAR